MSLAAPVAGRRLRDRDLHRSQRIATAAMAYRRRPSRFATTPRSLVYVALGLDGVSRSSCSVWGLGALAADNSSSSSNPLVVNVTGQQWVWSFSYPGTARQSPTSSTCRRTVKWSSASPHEDVTHGFWVANIGVQVDANPGVITTIHTTPDRLGPFIVRCEQFCGLNHAFMDADGSRRHHEAIL